DLQTRAQEAIEAQATRGERDKAAQAAVAAARKMFESGDGPGAIAQLEAFTPKHDLVSAFLATLKGEKVPEPEFAGAAGGETAHILRGARGATEDLPARRNMLIAVSSFAVILIAVMAIYRPWENAAPSLTESPGALGSAGPLNAINLPPPIPAPTPPVVTAPVVEATDPNGPDLTKAYDAIKNNRLDDAVRLASVIRKRDAKYAGLAGLLLAIDNQRAFEVKQKEAASAAAAASLAAANAPSAAPAKPLSDPVEPAPSPTAPVASVLPGGGFVVESAPTTPLLRGQVERPAIEAAIREWSRAVGTMNIATISNVRSFDKKQAQNWQDTYKIYKAIEMSVKLTDDPEVNEKDEAVVPVQETLIVTQKNGIKLTQTRTEKYRLHKIGDKWRLLPP
ncbi:MAG: hypothetical protein Q7R30_17395, partial [Acidobacteriota bacterium]|nr:hypothetical protein [Acidobacteriota bacterium]